MQRPLVGWAPDWWWQGEFDSSLYFLQLSWADLEPEEGQYVFDQWAQKVQFDRLKQAGKRLVFRLILDRPSPLPRYFLPLWLVKQVHLTSYQTSFGQGWAPDYWNPVLAQAYVRLVEKLGQAWGQDGFLAYIELGGLGHWGEWHQASVLGSLPQGSFAQAYYVDPWLSSFRSCQFCLRRSFAWLDFTFPYQFYHDELGNLAQTQIWLQELESGGISFDGVRLKGLGARAHQRIRGGEWSAAFSQTSASISLLQQLHSLGLSFIGPSLPQQADTAHQVLTCLGYDLLVKRVRCLSTLVGSVLFLEIKNSGSTVFPFFWSFFLIWESCQGRKGRLLLDWDLQQVAPGTCRTFRLWLPFPLPAYRSLSLAIQDPLNQEDTWIFSQKKERQDGVLPLYHL